MGKVTLTYHRAAQHDDLMPVSAKGLSEREDILGQANTVHGVPDMLEVSAGCFCCKAYFLNGLAVAGILTRPAMTRTFSSIDLPTLWDRTKSTMARRSASWKQGTV